MVDSAVGGYVAHPLDPLAEEELRQAENTDKPIGLTSNEEVPPMVDHIRFFAGAARPLVAEMSHVMSYLGE